MQWKRSRVYKRWLILAIFATESQITDKSQEPQCVWENEVLARRNDSRRISSVAQQQQRAMKSANASTCTHARTLQRRSYSCLAGWLFSSSLLYVFCVLRVCVSVCSQPAFSKWRKIYWCNFKLIVCSCIHLLFLFTHCPCTAPHIQYILIYILPFRSVFVLFCFPLLLLLLHFPFICNTCALVFFSTGFWYLTRILTAWIERVNRSS